VASKHITKSKKMCHMLNKINQNKTFSSSYHLKHNNHGKLVLFPSYECQGP